MNRQPWNLQVIPVGPLQMNAVLLTAPDPDGGEAILIDPGDEPERLLTLIENTGCRLTHLLATHGHFDHVGAAAAIQKHHDLPLLCHPADGPLIQQMPAIQTAYGFPATTVPRYEARLEAGDSIPFGGLEISIRHIPGHSPGELMYVLPGLDPLHVLVGDCLFYGSVGRTDLPGGDFSVLEKSIREHIYVLPDDSVVICGHGPDTTVGHEKKTNPFVPAQPDN